MHRGNMLHTRHIELQQPCTFLHHHYVPVYNHHTHNLTIAWIERKQPDTNKPGFWSELWQKLWCYVSPALMGSPCARYSSSGAGACRYTATVFCIQASNYFCREDGKEETEQCSVRLTLPFRDACLLKVFVYHKAASRWLGKLHRNVSGTLGWINFCALLN